MENFEFMSPTKFILAKDAETGVGQLIRSYSKKALFVHSGDRFMTESGLRERILASLSQAGVTAFELPGVTPNPVLGPIYEGIRLCRENDVGLVLAVGGGSVIDTAKAIGIGVPYNGDVWDFYTGKAHPTTSLPVGAVMTLPATGSEGSNGSVVSNDETKQKLDVMDDCIRPVFAVMNPEITYTLPPFQTACGVVDMISHAMERYFTSSKNTDLIDRVGEALMKSAMVNARKVLLNPRDYDARAELMWCAILSHNGLSGTGRTQDWACHAMGTQLSGQYHCVHGATLSALIPYWMQYVLPGNEARFAQFARRVMDINLEDDAAAATAGIAALKEFYQALCMPLSIRALGIETDDLFEIMAKNAVGGGTIGCIKALGAADVYQIYQMARG